MSKYFRLTHIFLIILTAVLLIQSGCAVNPVTGKKEIMLISESMEIEMGKEIDRGLKMEYGIYDDPQLNAYVESIGREIVPQTHRPHLLFFSPGTLSFPLSFHLRFPLSTPQPFRCRHRRMTRG